MWPCVCARMFVCVLLDVMIVDKVLGASAVILSHTDRYAARTPSRQCYTDPHIDSSCAWVSMRIGHMQSGQRQNTRAWTLHPNSWAVDVRKDNDRRGLWFIIFSEYFLPLLLFFQKLCRNKWKLQNKTKVKKVFYHSEVGFLFSIPWKAKNPFKKC